MARVVVKTAGQVAFEDFQAAAGNVLTWKQATNQAAWEAFAAKHNIQPIVENVPDAPPTDGELMEKAYHTTTNWPRAAAEFLRLRAERDGVRPVPVPHVTAEMAGDAISVYLNTYVAVDAYRADIQAAADYTNAELAKQAGK